MLSGVDEEDLVNSSEFLEIALLEKAYTLN